MKPRKVTWIDWVLVVIVWVLFGCGKIVEIIKRENYERRETD